VDEVVLDPSVVGIAVPPDPPVLVFVVPVDRVNLITAGPLDSGAVDSLEQDANKPIDTIPAINNLLILIRC
jgi:hypothetical protein